MGGSRKCRLRGGVRGVCVPGLMRLARGQIVQCKSLINAKLTEMDQPAPAGGDGPFQGGMGGHRAPPPQAQGQTIEVPENMVGQIIGKQGSYIRHVEMTSQARAEAGPADRAPPRLAPPAGAPVGPRASESQTHLFVRRRA